MITKPTFFFSPFCEFCQTALDAIGPVFTSHGVELIIRMPSLREKVEIAKVPALFIPSGYFGLDQPHILFGGGIPTWLRTITDGTENTDN